MTGKIFINYRRGDDPGHTGRLFDQLQNAFTPEQLFMDVVSIAPGLDFVGVLEYQVSKCDVLLVVIGKGWIDARDAAGNRRLDDPEDFVRLEIEAGLRLGKRVIPVLVNGAEMPRAEQLPETLKPLSRRSAIRLTHDRFQSDVQDLIKAIHAALEEGKSRPDQAKPPPAPRWSKRALLIGSALILAVVGIGLTIGFQPPSGVRLKPPIIAEPLTPERERALKPKDTFKECPTCPEMVVVPAGTFTMGSPDSEEGHDAAESPQHRVTLARQFAVGRFAVTFEEWDACVADGGCNGHKPQDQGWGRGRLPVINVSSDDAKSYVTWISTKMGKTYRLLSESEREYVTRAGTTTPFWWGGSISTTQANYTGIYTYGGGARGEYRQRTVPVDSFEPNPWGLYQVHGNVDEAVQDCYHSNYTGAPADGTAWTSDNCKTPVLRGGSWISTPAGIRSAVRSRGSSNARVSVVGFRVARTLLAP